MGTIDFWLIGILLSLVAENTRSVRNIMGAYRLIYDFLKIGS